MTDQLSEIICEGKLIEINGGSLIITPLKVRELPAFTRALQPIIEPLGQIMGGAVSQGGLVSLMAEGEHLIDAVVIASREPDEWVNDLELDDFILLAMAVMEVNADFFARRLMPMMEKVLSKAAGMQSASDSSRQVTATG
ncbi:MAG: hypothetical protein WBO93_08865 [Gammaproteobacteria bacterium]